MQQVENGIAGKIATSEHTSGYDISIDGSQVATFGDLSGWLYHEGTQADPIVITPPEEMDAEQLKYYNALKAAFPRSGEQLRQDDLDELERHREEYTPEEY